MRNRQKETGESVPWGTARSLWFSPVSFHSQESAQVLICPTHRGCYWPPNNPLPSHSSCPVHTSLSSPTVHYPVVIYYKSLLPVAPHLSLGSWVLYPGSMVIKQVTLALALAFAALKLCDYCCCFISGLSPTLVTL